MSLTSIICAAALLTAGQIGPKNMPESIEPVTAPFPMPELSRPQFRADTALVEMSGGGWASPACDEAALAQNMLRLYRLEPDARARMGRAAFAWYEGHYTRAALLAQLERFILE